MKIITAQRKRKKKQINKPHKIMKVLKAIESRQQKKHIFSGFVVVVLVFVMSFNNRQMTMAP